MEGRTAWKFGVVGFFTRLRGIALSALFLIATMGSPWWWPSSVPDSIPVNIKLGAIILLPIFAITVVAGFVYLRKRTIRSLDIKACLHDLAHYLRDHQSKIYHFGLNRKTAHEESVLESLTEHCDHVCEHIKDYFALMTHDSTINAAIRIAVETSGPDGAPHIAYRTLGRSSGLNRLRADTTEDISADRGIPRYLIEEQDCKGVLRYNDIDEAERLGAFYPTKNDKLYSHEIRTMLIAPINGWDGKKRSMLGILFVTARNDRVFERAQVDSMKFVSDMIAPSFAFTAHHLKSAGLLKEIRRVQ